MIEGPRTKTQPCPLLSQADRCQLTGLTCRLLMSCHCVRRALYKFFPQRDILSSEGNLKGVSNITSMFGESKFSTNPYFFIASSVCLFLRQSVSQSVLGKAYIIYTFSAYAALGELWLQNIIHAIYISYIFHFIFREKQTDMLVLSNNAHSSRPPIQRRHSISLTLTHSVVNGIERSSCIALQ